MCISGISDNEGRSACPICKQKIKFIDDIPACSQCRRLLYHNNAAEIQNKFYKTAEKMKNLADNNSESSKTQLIPLSTHRTLHLTSNWHLDNMSKTSLTITLKRAI